MSIILAYKSDGETLRDPSGTQRFTTALNFNQKRYGVHVVRAAISAFIANIYDATEAGLASTLSNNRFLINITNGVVSTDYIVVLPSGIYDVNLLNLALLDIQTAQGWVTTGSDPVLLVNYNPATQKVYMEIIDANFAPAFAGYAMTVDFTNYQNFKELLGFTADTYTNGAHTAANAAKLNWYGDSVNVILEGFGNLSWRGGSTADTSGIVSQSKVIATIPLSKRQGNEYVVTADEQPWIECRPDSTLSALTVSFKGSRPDVQKNNILLLEGSAELVIEVKNIS